MAKSKDGRGSASRRRESSETDIPTNPEGAPLAPPDPALQIVGSFVAHYTAQGGSGTAWVPQSTIVEAFFDRFGAVHGIIHRNPGGTEVSVINFRGNYALDHNADLGTIAGIANFGLVNGSTGEVDRRQELYIVKRSASEIFFMLARSYKMKRVYPPVSSHEPYHPFHQVDTKASVEGVFYKIG